MKICYNEATSMKNSTLKKDLEFCEKHGYDFIEIRLDKLNDYLKENTVEDLAAFFKNSKIKPYSFNALEFITFRDEAGYEDIKSKLQFCCKIGNVIGCSKVVAVPTFDVGPYTTNAIKKETVAKLIELSDLAKPFGMNLAFEFVGYPNCSVNTFEQAFDIVKTVDRENVGMVVDCFHFHAMNSKWEALESIPKEKIFIFHIDDSDDFPVGYLRDDMRVWPGDGVIDLKRIFEILKAKGYSEMASVELFRPEYWDMDIETCIKVAKEKTVAVINQYLN